MVLHWFRADLRLADNPALTQAQALAEQLAVPLLALYISTPAQWRAHDVGDARVDFEVRSVQALAQDLYAHGIDFHCLTCPDYGAIPQLLLDWCQAQGITQVFANRQYEFNETERDRSVHRILRKNSIEITWHHDQCLIEPERVRTQNGDCYTVFTPYKNNVLRQWHAHMQHALPRIAPMPSTASDAAKLCAVPELGDAFWGDYTPTPHTHADWVTGEDAAQARLDAFCADSLHRYAQDRDHPSIRGTSGLSPYLAVGALSARQCWHRAQLAVQTQEASELAAEKWQTELIWRDFYRYIMIGFPYVGQNLPFKKDTQRVAWDKDEAVFAAWCEGRTGYPLVDAAMRCLNATHFMHNRLRMVCAMFLVKDLLIDWRWGERYFAQNLIDFDFASNNGGWQWSASTGNDAVPYFRIFNPTKQSETYDAQGTFIKKWLPELRDCPVKEIHAPKNPQQFGYAAPIVVHAQARQRFLEAWQAMSVGLKKQWSD